MEGIDVKRQTIPLSLRSSLITTMFTPWGRYRWTRLPLVISSASKERQRQIHMVLDGLLSFGITHGILIPGCGANDMEARIDHDHSLITVLEGFEHHVKVNVNKMKFLICKATFMSHVTTTDGLQPNPITLKAMITIPTPTEKQEVRLGAALLQTIKPHSSSALDESSLRPIAYCKRPNHYRGVLCANRKRVPGYC